MAKSNETPDTKASDRKPVKGAKVDLIHCNGQRLPATVTDVVDDEGMLVNLVTNDKKHTITSSPFDPEGKKADAWAWPLPEAKASETKAG